MSTVDEHQARPCRGDPELPGAVGKAATAGAGQPPTKPSGECPRPGSDLVTEAEAYATYRSLLEDKELRRARQSGALGYLRRKRTVLYRRDELEAFVRGIIEEGYVEPWQAPGAKPSTRTRTTTPIAMLPASAGHAAGPDTIPTEVYEKVLRRAAHRRGR